MLTLLLLAQLWSNAPIVPDAVLEVRSVGAAIAFQQDGTVRIVGPEDRILRDFWPVVASVGVMGVPSRAGIGSLSYDPCDPQRVSLSVSLSNTVTLWRWSVTILPDGDVTFDGYQLPERTQAIWRQLGADLKARCTA